ncbi:MAG: type II toxin-antitoxin system RelE family toxin [Candidatus Brocadiales bacterium]
MWRIELSKQVNKFIEKENIKDTEILVITQKFINYSKGLDENIDVKKLKGKYKGFYRIKTGKTRMIVEIDFKDKTVFIDRIDYRGDVYK